MSTQEGLLFNPKAVVQQTGLKPDTLRTLGDMDYLGTEIDWTKGLFRNHHVPIEALQRYLSTYQQALRDNLDERGAPLIVWLDRGLRENGFD